MKTYRYMLEKINCELLAFSNCCAEESAVTGNPTSNLHHFDLKNCLDSVYVGEGELGPIMSSFSATFGIHP